MIQKIEWLAGKFPIWGENIPFWAIIPNIGCLAGKFTIKSNNPKNWEFCWIRILHQNLNSIFHETHYLIRVAQSLFLDTAARTHESTKSPLDFQSFSKVFSGSAKFIS